jgi:hypothetical protein
VTLQPTKSQAEIFRKIFVYHNIDENEVALQLWTDDLFKYNSEIITQAWNEWRMNSDRKPKPWDIAKIANRLKYVEESRKIEKNLSSKSEKIKRGMSWSTDIILDQLELARKNNPDFEKHMKQCTSIKSKCELYQACIINDVDKINSILDNEEKISLQNEQKEVNKSDSQLVQHEEHAQNQLRANSTVVKSILNDKMSELSWLLQD